MAALLPPKQDVLLALLQESSVHIHLDPRREAVVVPPWFKNQPQLVLQIGLTMPIPIPDLDVGDDGISCTLSFNRSPFYCFVPWTALYAMVGEDGRGMVWPNDVPIELATKAQASLEIVESADDPAPSEAQPGDKKRGRGAPKKKSAKGKGLAVKSGGKAGKAERRLSAVPAPAPSDPALEGPAATSPSNGGASQPRRQPQPALASVPEPTDSESSAVEGDSRAPDPPRKKGGPKRELPPYLRVIK